MRKRPTANSFYQNWRSIFLPWKAFFDLCELIKARSGLQKTSKAKIFAPSDESSLHPVSKLCIFFIRIYQWTISPLLGPCCRFHPSCSKYCAEAIEKHGVVKGCFLGALRILKCGPWHKGGIDLVHPSSKEES